MIPAVVVVKVPLMFDSAVHVKLFETGTVRLIVSAGSTRPLPLPPAVSLITATPLTSGRSNASTAPVSVVDPDDGATAENPSPRLAKPRQRPISSAPTKPAQSAWMIALRAWVNVGAVGVSFIPSVTTWSMRSLPAAPPSRVITFARASQSKPAQISPTL